MVEAPRLRVFVSYARDDCTAFADELVAGLELAGFEPFIDRQDIAGGEDWDARLGGLIQSADTVLFVISPEAAASDHCAREVAKAETLSKRIIPIVAIDTPQEKVPAGLRRLQFISFTKDRSFTRGLAELAVALRTDLDWIREHTRYAEAAARWRDREKSEVLLLRGSELEAAKTWLAAWKPGAPEPTDLQRAFIGESETAEQVRLSAERQQLAALAEAQTAREEAFKRLSRRTAVGLVGAGGLITVAAGAGIWGLRNRSVALEEREAREAAEARSVETMIVREAARTDIRGQIAITTGARRQGASATDEPSAYGGMLLEEIVAPNNSVLQAAERVNRRFNSADLSHRLLSDVNGALYLGRPSSLPRRAIVVSVANVGGRTFAAHGQDADRWAQTLEGLSFSVQRLSDPDAEALLAAVRAPSERPELVLFYFAGGGVWLDGDEYLLAADARFASRADVQTTALSANVVHAAVGSRPSAPSILVLDTSFLDFRLAAL